MSVLNPAYFEAPEPASGVDSMDEALESALHETTVDARAASVVTLMMLAATVVTGLLLG